DDELERDLLVADPVAVEHSPRDVAAVGDALEERAHRRLAVVEHPLDDRREDLPPVALDDLRQRSSTCAETDDLGVQVAREQPGHAAVGEQRAVEVVLALAAPGTA